MKSLRKNYKRDGTLHHAYLISGEREIIIPDLLRFVETDLKFVTKGNPDFWHTHFEIFGIDEGRVLKELQSRKSFSGSRKVFIISADAITREAQNALLKIFEEPTPDTHFFLVLSSPEILLPTLRSRLFIINAQENDSTVVRAKNTSLATSFLNEKPAGRLKLLKKMIENKEKTEVISFFNDLELALRKETKNGYTKEITSALDEVLQGRSYLNDRAPSLKIILEHLALALPLM